eukprot:3463530-Amphidinium_carterae.1
MGLTACPDGNARRNGTNSTSAGKSTRQLGSSEKSLCSCYRCALAWIQVLLLRVDQARQLRRASMAPCPVWGTEKGCFLPHVQYYSVHLLKRMPPLRHHGGATPPRVPLRNGAAPGPPGHYD